MTFGTFIAPDHELAALSDPNEKLGIPIYSGYRAAGAWTGRPGRSRIFDRIAARLRDLDIPYEDQCSAQYYLDLVDTLRDFNGEFDRVVEVGVYMGGSSAVFGGCIEPFDFDLDLIDVVPEFLRFAHERIRRTHPESIGRVRLFHGDLPAYVRAVMLSDPARCVVHHDGAHDFNQVVKDMASLYYVRDRLHAIIAQDTHLRGTLEHMNFVDMALYAVFGLDLNYAPIGTAYAASDGRTSPNKYQGNYFTPETPEGFVLPMAMNAFRYPHPSMKLDGLLKAAA